MDIGCAVYGEERPAPGISGTHLELGYHGEAVVKGASIRIRPGEVTALVGPNGSGKSTLLRALARLHRPRCGEIRLADGCTAAGLSAREFSRRVAMLTQSRPTPAGVTVADVVAYGRHPHRGRWRGTDPGGTQAIARALNATGLTDLAATPVDELSGGQRQRAWLAVCLAQETAVLLLDEPTTYLDLRYQVEILDLARDLAEDGGVAVGVVLHDLNQAAEIADTVVLLHQGTVHAEGSPEAVLTEENLSEAYGLPIEVAPNPATGRPTARPVGRRAGRARQRAPVP